MAQLPKHILKSLRTNSTSLGQHPSYPPDEEEAFIVNTMINYFDKSFGNVDVNNIDELKVSLGRLISACQKIERKKRRELETLCYNTLTKIFKLPEDSIEINIELVETIDVSNQRKFPEQTVGFEFDSITDMKQLTEEVYKRRMLNALVCGSAIELSENFDLYINELFKIDNELPSLYAKILKYNKLLLFFEQNIMFSETNGNTSAGVVDVEITNADDLIKITAKGVIFPILLEECIKGVLELAISHGLPKNRKKAEYVVGKSDFRLAEVWDMRLGIALWDIIKDSLTVEVEPNFLLMQISEIEPNSFNELLQEVFAKTAKGKQMLNDIAKKINYQREKEKFDSFIKTKNDEIPLEDGYFETTELISDSTCII